MDSKGIFTSIAFLLMALVTLLGVIVFYAGSRANNNTFIWIGLLLLLPYGIWKFVSFVKNKKQEEKKQIE